VENSNSALADAIVRLEIEVLFLDRINFLPDSGGSVTR